MSPSFSRTSLSLMVVLLFQGFLMTAFISKDFCNRPSFSRILHDNPPLSRTHRETFIFKDFSLRTVLHFQGLIMVELHFQGFLMSVLHFQGFLMTVLHFQGLFSPSFSSIRQACQIVYQLTHLGPMEFFIKLHTIESRWPILYIEGSQDIIKKMYFFLWRLILC